MLAHSIIEERALATPNYAYEKRQRELAKKRKAEEKRQRKVNDGQRSEPAAPADAEAPPPGGNTPARQP